MNDVNDHTTHDTKPSTQNRNKRIAAATIIGAIVVSYIVAVLAGAIVPVRQLSAADLVLLVLVGGLIMVILRPETLKEISSLSAAGVRIDLNHVQERQRELQDFLNEIFPLLLPTNVFQHLKNLESAENGYHIVYNGTDGLRRELRQLRYMGLIRVKPPHKGIGDILDSNFSLGEYVELTDQGRHWIKLAPQVTGITRR